MSYYLSYDSDGNRVEKTSVNGKTKTITSGTDSEGNSFVSNDGVTAKTVTDDFGRITEVKTSREKGISVYYTTYEYASGSAQNSTTNLVKSLTQKFGNTQLLKYEYKYDSNGNITRIEEGGEVVAMYWYDELNQLVSSSERDSGLYTVYSYDKAGNITNVKEYELDLVKWYPLSLIRERTYKYTDSSWKDKLTSYNGTNITYDKIGNPLTYRDGMTMTWENGRQLATLKTGENEVSYKYDSNGLRTQKEDDNGTTYYYYDSNKNLIGLTKGYKTLYFYYDSQGSPTSFSYNGEMYYYVKNLQGDIVKVINKTGVLYARYEYDAFGKILYAYGDPIISALSPFRYRGYVYDTETGLYYLQSRYYDPVTGRFLNADDTAFVGATGTVLSTNLFTYCENNAIKNVDTNGNIAANVIGSVIGGIVGVVGGVFLTNWLADKLKLSGWKRNVFVWGLTAVIGAAAAVIGYFIGPYVAKIAVKLGQYVANLIRKGKIVFKKLTKSAKSSIRTLIKQTCCFVAETPVSTPKGQKTIDSIKKGDIVYSEDPVSGKIEEKKVEKVFVRKTNILYHIQTQQDEIITTSEHPFWVNNSEWTEAKNLIVGDMLLSQDGSNIEITYIYIEYLDKPISVYNFEVDDLHTYFVGKNSILVHNKCSFNKISNSVLKKNKLDAHALKRELLGKKAKIASYDLYYDKSTKAIFILKKGKMHLRQ